MKAYGRMEVQHYSFLSLVPDGVESSIYCLDHCTSGGKGFWIPLKGSQSRAGFLERDKNFLFLVGFELRISQPVT
jgi:hypothetical protein